MNTYLLSYVCGYLSIYLSVLQFARETEPMGNEDIYYKRLVHMIMKADNLRSTRWIGKSETPESQWCSSSSKESRFKTLVELMFQFRFKGKKDLVF